MLFVYKNILEKPSDVNLTIFLKILVTNWHANILNFTMRQLSGLNRYIMENNNNYHSNPILLFLVGCVSLLFTSCELVEGIFKAGMGVGIFIVVAIVVAIVALIFKLGKK